MHPRLWKFIIFAGSVAALSGLAFRQWQANEALRTEAGRLRTEGTEIERLQSEHDRLMARATPPEESTALEEAAAEVARLRSEAAILRRQIEERRASAETVSPAFGPAAAAAAEPWTNAGRETALAAFQTGVWALQQGDTDALAGLITFDAAGRALVEALFARLPPESRALHGSAENVFATLLAARLPTNLASADIITSTAAGTTDETLRLRLNRTNGSTKEANFNFTRDTGGWRIVVPTTVVADYIAKLRDGLPSRPDPSTLRAGAVTVGAK
ncbi:MAG TPA: hypothetical protein VHO24_11560 [Opitutaceae bacterium]|nr:hypothetical protein [Opitutaceae bacterium]